MSYILCYDHCLHQVGELLQLVLGDVDWFVGDDPGDRLLAAGLGEAAIVGDELVGGGDQR